jgi:hypothetical protein
MTVEQDDNNLDLQKLEDSIGSDVLESVRLEAQQIVQAELRVRRRRLLRVVALVALVAGLSGVVGWFARDSQESEPLPVDSAPGENGYELWSSGFQNASMIGWEMAGSAEGVVTHAQNISDGSLEIQTGKNSGFLTIGHKTHLPKQPFSISARVRLKARGDAGPGRGSNGFAIGLGTSVGESIISAGWRQNEYNDFPI